jgi:hypothetical protein
LFVLAALGPVHALSSFQSVAPARSAATGRPVDGADAPGRPVLSNEPDGAAGTVLDFDLGAVAANATPMARITLELEKLPVKRPGQGANVERGAIHVFAVTADGHETLAGSIHLKPGGTSASYPVDVTGAVNAVLANPAGARKLRLAVRLAGKPAAYEVYALPAVVPSLEIAALANWSDDWEKRVASILRGSEIYRESCLAVAEDRTKEVELRLLYPARKVTEVIALGTGERLEEGRDWILRSGRVFLPPGTRAPVQLAAEFYLAPHTEKDGSTKMIRNAVKLVAGSWYHERQMEVTYEPAVRDWTWPAALSSLADLPRTTKLLQTKAPLTVVLFGDSISEGFDASSRDGVWPYQPAYGELVVRQLRKIYGAPITFLNHARAGGTSAHATTQIDSQVAWFKPDLVLLAYGMNDRSESRRVDYRANLEKIIDAVRVRSPQAEFVVITPMLNNPKQPTGLGPVKFIRDEALRVARPGVAFVDVTSTELAMLERKDYLDLSGNGANHPNDFLHRIYAQRILEVLTP